MHKHAITACKAAKAQLDSALSYVVYADQLLHEATDDPEQGVVNKGVNSDVRADVFDAEDAIRRARRRIQSALNS